MKLRRVALLAVLVAGLAALGWMLLRPHLQRPVAVPAVAQYVGAAACAGCHQAETAAWRTSHHAVAMQVASPATVLGRFDDARLTENGVTSTFFRKGEAYFVRTDGADGKLADFEVRYTFGVYPLQQYLAPFPDGRMQALALAWDARPAAQGGQRWFHLYAGQGVDHRDPLHWTRLDQNWNFMCAACHSTSLRRNYDAAQDRYASTWSDIGVACESCHGPGSRHLDWAAHEPRTAGDKGLEIALDERRGVQWRLDAGNGNSSRSAPLQSHREVETCAFCHVRGAVLGDRPGPTGHLLDTHDPALLRADLYYADGQQQGEDYIYGSFVQSRMYAMGVTCSDCHEPHTMKLRAEGNAVCAQCHAAAKYDNAAHTMHAAGRAGALCADCHMPLRTYMTVDGRRDHSIRVPRPDLSVRYGMPNACNGCHRDKDAAWAAASIERHFGPERKGYQHFADALAGARLGLPGTRDKLTALAADAGSPGIARATAIAELAAYPGREALAAVRAALQGADPLLRSAALDTLLGYPPAVRAALALPLVDDAANLVRIKAGRVLADVPDALLTPAQQGLRERAWAAYRQSQEALAERPESHVNLGSVHAGRGEAQAAAAEYRAALRRDADFVPAWADLVDLYRSQGDEAQVAAVLAEGLERLPGNAELTYLTGLQRVRTGQLAAALPLLAQATKAAPGDAHYAYVYAVALDGAGQAQAALGVLQEALRKSPYSPELLQAAAAFEKKAGRAQEAEAYRRRYEALGTQAP